MAHAIVLHASPAATTTASILTGERSERSAASRIATVPTGISAYASTDWKPGT